MIVKIVTLLLYLTLSICILLFPFLKLSLPIAQASAFRAHFVQGHLEEGAAQRLNNNVILFLQGKEALDPAFTRSEAGHMHDVQRLFSHLNTFFSVSLLLLLCCSLLLLSQKRSNCILNAMGWSGLTILGLGATLLLLLLWDFQACFIYFHEWFFPQGNWSFSPHSFLIQLYPRPFFMAIGQLLFTLVLLEAVVVLFLSFAMKKKLFKAFQTLF